MLREEGVNVTVEEIKDLRNYVKAMSKDLEEDDGAIEIDSSGADSNDIDILALHNVVMDTSLDLRTVAAQEQEVHAQPAPSRYSI